MRLLEHLKSLPPEDQLARKAELMDAARTGDRFGFDDSYLAAIMQPAASVLTWHGAISR